MGAWLTSPQEQRRSLTLLIDIVGQTAQGFSTAGIRCSSVVQHPASGTKVPHLPGMSLLFALKFQYQFPGW